MTAVEKIILEIDNELQTLESCHGKEIFGRKVGLAFAKRVAKKAKELEKEQHQETWETAYQAGRFEGKYIAEENWQTFEPYWEEKFKSE